MPIDTDTKQLQDLICSLAHMVDAQFDEYSSLPNLQQLDELIEQILIAKKNENVDQDLLKAALVGLIINKLSTLEKVGRLNSGHIDQMTTNTTLHDTLVHHMEQYQLSPTYIAMTEQIANIVDLFEPIYSSESRLKENDRKLRVSKAINLWVSAGEENVYGDLQSYLYLINYIENTRNISPARYNKFVSEQGVTLSLTKKVCLQHPNTSPLQFEHDSFMTRGRREAVRIAKAGIGGFVARIEDVPKISKEQRKQIEILHGLIKKLVANQEIIKHELNKEQNKSLNEEEKKELRASLNEEFTKNLAEEIQSVEKQIRDLHTAQLKREANQVSSVLFGYIQGKKTFRKTVGRIGRAIGHPLNKVLKSEQLSPGEKFAAGANVILKKTAKGFVIIGKFSLSAAYDMVKNMAVKPIKTVGKTGLAIVNLGEIFAYTLQASLTNDQREKDELGKKVTGKMANLGYNVKKAIDALTVTSVNVMILATTVSAGGVTLPAIGALHALLSTSALEIAHACDKAKNSVEFLMFLFDLAENSASVADVDRNALLELIHTTIQDMKSNPDKTDGSTASPSPSPSLDDHSESSSTRSNIIPEFIAETDDNLARQKNAALKEQFVKLRDINPVQTSEKLKEEELKEEVLKEEALKEEALKEEELTEEELKESEISTTHNLGKSR